MTDKYKFSSSIAMSTFGFFLRRRELLIRVTIRELFQFKSEIQNYKVQTALCSNLKTFLFSNLHTH
jgi:hypothetical protein